MNEAPSEHVILAAFVQELGYRALIQDSGINTAMSGLNVIIFHWPNDSLQMYVGIALDEEDGFGFDQINELNAGYRFMKCYLRPAGVSFEQDYLFNISANDAKDRLERILRDWESSIGTVRDALRQARIHHREQKRSAVLVEGEDSTF